MITTGLINIVSKYLLKQKLHKKKQIPNMKERCENLSWGGIKAEKSISTITFSQVL